MKRLLLLLFTAAVLLTGCNTPVSRAVHFEGKESYKVTMLGDIHFDGPQYHIEPLSERAAKLHYTQWQGRSQQVLAAAAQCSKDTVPFVIQLGDIINGDCDNAERQGAAVQGAFDTVKKFFPDRKLLSVLGNHEYRGKQGVLPTPRKHLVPLIQKEFGRDVPMKGMNYSVRYGKDLFIFYDFRTGSSGEFVKEIIKSNSDARHIFFLTHLPMFPCSIGNPGWVVPQFKELIPLLAAHKAVVVCAHTHSMNYIVYKCDAGVLPQVTVTSMGREWSPGTPLKVRCNSYDEWLKGVKPHYYTVPRYRKYIDNLKYFNSKDFLSYSVGTLDPSGFIQIEVNGDRVINHIFTDNSGKPVKSIVLK